MKFKPGWRPCIFWTLVTNLSALFKGASCNQGVQCNVTPVSPSLPCRLPRCRYTLRQGRNTTERGLHYHFTLLRQFFDEWENYQGFLGKETAFFMHLIGAIQSDHGIFGTIGEIGVAAGKSFATLALTRRAGEPLFACDIFAGAGHPSEEKEGVKVEEDNAAMANLPMFLDTLAYVGMNPGHVLVHDGASFELTDTYLFGRGIPPFRIIHIDGGHFMEATLHDLRVAACTLAPGGVIMVDDLNNGIFPGVQEGFHRFMLLDRPRLRPDLVPFLLIGRIYLADRPYAERYRKALEASLPENAFWKSTKFLYGAEVLLPGGLMNVGTSISNIIDAEEEFFPWPRRWRTYV